MNPKGKPSNLQASHPENRHAQKTGVYSERRRAEKAGEVRQAMDKDLKGFLAQDALDALAQAVAASELMAQDIAEQGVTDGKGKLRRVVGAHARGLKLRLDLGREIEAGLAVSAAEARHAEPWSQDEGRRLLRNIAHNTVSAPAASIKAIEMLNLLDEQAAPSDYNREFFDELMNMPLEKLEREVAALSIPITTGRRRGPGEEKALEPLLTLIRRLASQGTIQNHDLTDLQMLIFELSNPRTASMSTNADEC
ncbi:MAG TPA: hypothetical protein VGH46_01460 [Gaiellaceae bacterium]